MRPVRIIGVAHVPVVTDGAWPFVDSALAVLRAACTDAGEPAVQALYMPRDGAALCVREGSLAGVAAHGTENRDGIEGLALYSAIMAVAAGEYDIAAVVSVGLIDEGMGAGVGPLFRWIPAALIMRRYMYEYGWRHDDFASIAINAYSNAARAGLAQGPPPSLDDYRAAPVVVDPLCSLDYALWVESAVAVILCSSEHVGRCAGKPVTVTGAAVATDARDLAQRADILWLKAVERSAADAYRQAGRRPQDMDLFEPTDDATIMAALSLEASGFARKGESLSLASDGAIMIGGARPMSTLGGLLGRGKADACRLVLVADVVRQLRGEGGANQVDGAHIGMAQIAGDDGSFAAAFILEA